MGEINEKVAARLKESMKAGDKLALNTMRALKSALRYKEVELTRELEDAEEQEVLRREVRKRKESAGEYRKGGREEQAAAEDAEAAIIEEFLPAMLGEAEIEEKARAAIAETGASSKREMGKVMKVLMAELKGQADGRLVNEVVGRLLEE
ncbi:MAG: GatB/YqeY domain-containing protein [bacterium]